MSDLTPAPPAETPAAEDQRPDAGFVPWSVLDAMATFVLWLVVLFVGGSLILLALRSALEEQLAQAVMLPVTLSLLIAVTVGYTRARFKDGAALLRGWRRPTGADVGIGLGAGVAALVVLGLGLGSALQYIADALKAELPPVQETFRQLASNPDAAPWLVLSAVVVAPVAEELFWRGMLFTALRKLLPLWPSIGISALLFGLIHMQTTVDGYLMVLLIIIPLGMLLAYLYERRGTLLVPILVHATFNLIQVAQLINTT